MSDLGYVEGDNVDYLYSGTTDFEGLGPAIQRLIDRDVDLILALGTPAALAAQQGVEGTDVPVVFAPVYDPVKSGLVQSLVKPGGNLTGIGSGGRIAKVLEFHMAIVPDTSRIYVPHNPPDDASVQSLAELEIGAAALGIELVVVEVITPDELTAALDNVPKDVDAIFLLTSGLLIRHADEFAAAAIANGIPLSSAGSGASSGLLLGYQTDQIGVGRQASRLANKVLQGSSPSDLPVETAEAILSVNLKTGKEIGIEIPEEILQLSDLVVR